MLEKAGPRLFLWYDVWRDGERKAEGYVLGAAVKTLPLGGHDISEFILRRLRERNEPVPSEDILDAVKQVKESLCYCCGNLVKEFFAFDEDRSKFKTVSGINARTQQVVSKTITER